jgi:glycosyltransferase involved in cell wall biosynthesis
MKISYINSMCVRNDAISSAVRDEVAWLCAEGFHDVRLYSKACEFQDLPAVRAVEVNDVAFDSHFQASDLIVFHFGVYYPLFNLLPVIPKNARSLVVFHNVTPRELVAPEAIATVERSMKQMANIVFAHHVCCDSQVNLDVLREAGIGTPATVMSLAVHNNSEAPRSKPSAKDGVIRVAFVGRLVRAKGPTDLLEAVDRILRRNRSIQMRVDLMGKISFSDPTVITEIKEMAAVINSRFGNRITIALVGDASEQHKRDTLRAADLFVLPTYHEGFCVPVLEALGNGCKIVAYDNSNVPTICGGFATLAATGDKAALLQAMENTVEEVLSEKWRASDGAGYSEYARRAWRYTLTYSPEATRMRFLRFLDRFARSSV